jgi:hypothetical protein
MRKPHSSFKLQEAAFIVNSWKLRAVSQLEIQAGLIVCMTGMAKNTVIKTEIYLSGVDGLLASDTLPAGRSAPLA